MKKTKILYGITGIGHGHTFRQLPIVEHFARTCKIVILAYDASYNFYSARFKNHPRVKVLRIAVPFFVGSRRGINFEATAASPLNRGKDFLGTNCAALNRAEKILGKPDLVITDYEPISAQYAYAHGAPLVTIDQQSKYLCGNFLRAMHGFTFQDEIARLHMFFPRADARVACSFFRVPVKSKGDRVLIFPPIIKNAVLQMRRRAQDTQKNSILVYISSARDFVQTPAALGSIFAGQKGARFHIFIRKNDAALLRKLSSPNICVYNHGDPRFNEILKTCSGIVSTAGHSLLSEAMYLGIPVYAIPVSPYEQHMNAHVVNAGGFGISYPRLTAKKLAYFIKNIQRFGNAIRRDKRNLVRGVGQEKIIKFLEQKFLS